MQNPAPEVLNNDISKIRHLAKHVNSFVYYLLIAWDIHDETIRGRKNVADLLKNRYQKWHKQMVVFSNKLKYVSF